MDLSVVTVTWNSEKFIRQQIKSVRSAAGDLKYEQIVVDNNSSDKTTALVEEEKDIVLIKNKKNTGFAAANNLAVKQAKGKFILFLNPDMLLPADMLAEMVGYMKENKKIGIMTCRLQGPDAGPRRFPKTWEMAALILKIPHLIPGIFRKYHYKDLDMSRVQEVASVRGSFMLVRREIIEKLGRAFDERYFIWFEDVDFCREVRKLGYKIIYHPDFTCQDMVGQSFKQTDRVKRQKMFLTSLLIYFRKWEPWWKWMWLWLLRPVGVLLVKIFA